MSRKVNLDLERSPVGLGLRKVGQWVTYDQFTDGGGAAGTLSLSKQIPAGSFVIGSKVKVTTGFTGDTTAVMDVGISGDADRFSLTTHNVLAVASNLLENADAGAGGAAGLDLVTSDTTVVLTVTGASDFGLITAGKLYVEVFYLSTNPEIIDPVATIHDA
jgi:hypothetical protein